MLGDWLGQIALLQKQIHQFKSPEIFYKLNIYCFPFIVEGMIRL